MERAANRRGMPAPAHWRRITTSRYSAGTISDFIEKHPSMKILALSFLIMVGTLLVAEACDVHMPKGYLYFAMAFSLAVEAINIRIRTSRGKKANPVELHKDLPD